MERSFFDIFSDLDDPRHDKNKKYPLMDVIILAIYGTLIGFEDFTNMSYYFKKREVELVEKLELSAGIPSHDVFSDVFRAIDVEAFMELFVEWIKSIISAKTGDHIAIDGKAVRAATKRSAGERVPYIISAFLVGCGISIGQKIVGDKTNEITEIPNILDIIEIKESFVTIDAIGTQTKIMDKIIEKGGHFCLQLKANQKETFQATRLFFDDLMVTHPTVYEKLDTYREMTSNDHGRVEKREYRVLDNPNDIKLILGDRWPQVHCIGMAKLTPKTGVDESKEEHYHLLDLPVSAEKYASLARGHWEIENGLHWILDIHFREDSSTANSDHAIENLALLRKIAFNFTKLDPTMQKKTIKKKMIDYMTDLELFKSLIYEVLPSIS